MFRISPFYIPVQVSSLALCLVLLLAAVPKAYAAKPVVVSSLRPLQLLVQDIAQESVELQSLLSAKASPHEYSLRFSDLRRLQNADLLVWLGPAFESYLAKPLKAMSPSVPNLALLETATAQTSEHKHLHESHIWLDPRHVAAMLPEIALALGTANPSQKDQYKERASVLSKRLLALDEEFASLYEKLRGSGVITGHGGLEIFLQRYSLRHTGSLSGQQHAAPSLKRIIRLRSELELGNANCIATSLADGRLDPERIFPGLSLPTVRLDLLGVRSSNYVEMLTNVANSLYSCMTAKPS